jgi:hypothetical protein
MKKKTILFVGQAFYNAWYLSRELRKLGWGADLLNYDSNPHSAIFYHGEDFRLDYTKVDKSQVIEHITFFLKALHQYEIFHFSNAHALYFLNNSFDKQNSIAKPMLKRWILWIWKSIIKRGVRFDRIYRLMTLLGDKLTAHLIYYLTPYLDKGWDISLIKLFGKKITYANNGCLDGVSQTSFRKWETALPNESVCDICLWKDNPSVCSDERNLAWGKYKSEIVNYQFLLGGNRADYNIGENILEMPYFYCLDKNIWHPEILIPSNYKLPIAEDIVKIYHAVGNFDGRSSGIRTIKSTHVYVPLLDKLKREGYKAELIFFKDVPNLQVRYYQLQADIFVDMLTFGFFGANIREGMMLGKVCICYLRPVWLEQMRAELPEYVEELPIVNANPTNIEEILIDLIKNKEKRIKIGKKSREFAIKWHGSENAAIFFDKFYTKMLE